MVAAQETQYDSLLAILDKKARKFKHTWTKLKTTPPSITFLLHDLIILSTAARNAHLLARTSRLSAVTIAAIQDATNALQRLSETSSRHTARFARRALTTENLISLELALTDCKIRLLMVQFLLEKREASSSQTAVAEELAQLHARTVPRLSLEKSDFDIIEPKTDSLLSFKCYSELVGREKILLELEAEFQKSGLVVLGGLGGIGKNQIASEHALRFSSRQINSQVFWVDCESPTSFEASYRTIAEKSHLPGADDYRTDILERVRSHLNRSRTGKWLMILQNVSASNMKWDTSDGLTTLMPGQYPFNLLSHLPSASKGHILCISTEDDISSQWPEPPPVITVPAFYDIEAGILFESKVPQQLLTTAGTIPLARALGHLPLAICQAAAYMVATRCDAARYLILLKTDFPIQYQRTSEEFTDNSSLDPCFKTTSISFTRIQKQNPTAAELLSLMSVCHRKSISKSLLWHAWKHGLSDLTTNSNLPDIEAIISPPSPDKVADTDKQAYIAFSAALATLEAYLLVAYNALTETYSLHKVVQSTILTILQQQDTIATWRSSAIVLLSAQTHIFRLPKKPSACHLSTLILHISEVAHYPHTTTFAGLAKAKALCDVASFKISLMQPRASTPLLQQAFELQHGLLKAHDGRTLRTLLALAESTSYSDCPSASIPLYTQAIAGCKQTLGPGNRRTLFAQLNLCGSYILTNEIASAKSIHAQAQAAVSASLQISSEDRRKLEQRSSDLKHQMAGLQKASGRGGRGRPRSIFADDLLQKSRMGTLKQDRKRMTSRAFSASSRVSSLDSIVEAFEVEHGL